jgi:uncharacterized membrane protein (DUF4010 family)
MDPTLLEAIRLYGSALAIGLLIGLERERKNDSRGLRTFALVSMLGALLGALSDHLGQPALLAVAAGGIVLLSIAAYWHDHDPVREPPTTSMVAMAVTGLLGVLCGLGQAQVAVPIAVMVFALLFLKIELRGAASRLGRDDLIAILQFGVLTFIALPLLPDQAYGPYNSLNPHQIWLMVVLVAGVGLAGFLLLRFAGARLGAPLAAVAGGLVSSTATTLVFARHARAGGGAALQALLVMLSNLTMLVRLGIMAALVEPRLLAAVAVVVGAAIVATLPIAAWLIPRARRETDQPLPVVRNPTSLRVALSFGLAFGAISLLSAWATARLGERALYAVAAVSGLTDVDAIALSSFRLFSFGHVDASTGVTVVAIAIVANLAFKATVAFSAGTAELGRMVGIGFAAMATAIAAGVLLVVRSEALG